jgi:hypothetical protein
MVVSANEKRTATQKVNYQNNADKSVPQPVEHLEKPKETASEKLQKDLGVSDETVRRAFEGVSQPYRLT